MPVIEMHKRPTPRGREPLRLILDDKEIFQISDREQEQRSNYVKSVYSINTSLKIHPYKNNLNISLMHEKFTKEPLFVKKIAILSKIVKEERNPTWKEVAFCMGKKVSLEGTLNRNNICLISTNA